jgi:uncharacterized protein YdeI (YjbR/CyaY-like superfamily)
MGVQDHAERVEPLSLAAWSDWLAAHHGRGTGVWLVSARRAADRAFPYEDAVLEALRFGWVDSTVRPVDALRTMMWFAPRRRGSLWTRPNKERIARLEAEGRLEAAGRAAVEAARAGGTWTLLDAVEDGIVPDDLAAALAASPEARGHWEAFPASARKAIMTWVVTAKRPETRAARVRESVERAARGERAR